MADLLVDTDVFIDHLRGQRPFVPGRNRVFYSVITRAELSAGRNATEEPIRQLLAPFTEISVDRSIAEVGGALRRDTAMSLPDALIAATALLGELTLITRNARDFGRVHGLKSRSPA
jgi:predicted nucleic acid-binding protein